MKGIVMNGQKKVVECVHICTMHLVLSRDW